MRKLFILFSIIGAQLLVNPGANAQNTGVSVTVGGATFRMDDMKYLQDYILESYPVEGKITSSFPPYFTVSAGVVRQLYYNIRFGGLYGYSTTGGRSNYTDYSGKISTDMNAVSHRLGAFINYTFLENDRLDLSLFGRLDINVTEMTISSSVTILNFPSGISNEYRSIGPAGSAGLELLYKFKDAAIGIEGGYLVDMPGKLTDKDTGDEILDPNDRQRKLTADWTGWRLGIKGIYWLNSAR